MAAYSITNLMMRIDGFCVGASVLSRRTPQKVRTIRTMNGVDARTGRPWFWRAGRCFEKTDGVELFD